MLALPTSNFSQPIGTPPEIEHTIELSVLCDWIEGSVLFDNEDLSKADIVDVLKEEEVYDDPDVAMALVNDAWNELQDRLVWIGGKGPFSFFSQSIKSEGSWEENPAHSFCILLSMPQCYDNWSTALYQGDYSEQGRLFEALTKVSIEHQFSDWEVYPTGWSSKNPVKLSNIVDEIANRLGEIKGELQPWTNPRTKDGGLDLLCYRPFLDNRGGVPVYLMQCASGKDWENKLHRPNLNVWTKIIKFMAKPRKAFAIPFALPDKKFKATCTEVNGMLLDRYRILAAGNYNTEWISDSLKTDIIDWITPRLQKLERYDE